MKTADYQEQILSYLLGKYREKILSGKETTGRRIGTEPNRFLRNYAENTVDINEKQKLTEAVDLLEQEGFVAIKRLKYSDDILKIYFHPEKADAAKAWMYEKFGYVDADETADAIRGILNTLPERGELTAYYASQVEEALKLPGRQTDAIRVRDMLSLLYFLENNQKTVYLREASVLALGDSKKLEEQYLNEICALIRESRKDRCDPDSTQEDCLSLFFVMLTDREILIKGKWLLEWDAFSLDVSALPGGIAISGNEIETLRRIQVGAPEIMTVENKTSFQRMRADSRVLLYLGGFAGSQQVSFLKKVHENVPDIPFSHFGDIDVGGFLIHRHLTKRTGIDFALYCMDVKTLQDERFARGLQPLTQNDRMRAQTLLEQAQYRETIQYMLRHDVKLEQEIVSYVLEG